VSRRFIPRYIISPIHNNFRESQLRTLAKKWDVKKEQGTITEETSILNEGAVSEEGFKESKTKNNEEPTQQPPQQPSLVEDKSSPPASARKKTILSRLKSITAFIRSSPNQAAQTNATLYPNEFTGVEEPAYPTYPTCAFISTNNSQEPGILKRTLASSLRSSNSSGFRVFKQRRLIGSNISHASNAPSVTDKAQYVQEPVLSTLPHMSVQYGGSSPPGAGHFDLRMPQQPGFSYDPTPQPTNYSSSSSLYSSYSFSSVGNFRYGPVQMPSSTFSQYNHLEAISEMSSM
jgi:hypothetical protein